MQYNQHLLAQLEEMLHWKKGKKFYAQKLGVTEEEVDKLMVELRKKESFRNEAVTADYIDQLQQTIYKFEEDFIKGTGEITMNTPEEIKTLD